jgi:putative ABC transport system permease protein
MLKLAWKGAVAHKGRLALMMIAVVLGVAFVAGTYVFTDTAKDAFDELFEQEIGDSIIVRQDLAFGSGADYGRVPASLVPELEQIPGVNWTLPYVQGWAQMLDKEGEPIGGNGPPTFAFSWAEGMEELDATRLVDGDLPRQDGEVVIDVFSAEANDFVIGDTIQILTVAGVEEFEIVGLVGYGDMDSFLTATAALFDVETAQRVAGFEDEYTFIYVVAEPGVDREQLQAAVTEVLPEGTEAVLSEVTIEEGQDMVDEVFGMFNTVFLVFGVIAVFVAAFLIQNTYRIIVAQRTKELAMLRAVGASGAQVYWVVMTEAVLTGLIASAIGIGAGVLLALGLKAAFAGLGIEFPQGSLTVLPRTVVVGMVVGTLAVVFSALLPARKASRVPPVAALREIQSTFFKSLRLRAVIGCGILVAGVAVLLVGLYTEVGSSVLITGIGAGITFIGVSVIAPFIARHFGRIAGRPLPAVQGVTGRLAQENAVRKPRRTAATASALMIGVALVTVIATLFATFKGTIEETVRDEVIGEYQVQVAGGFGDPTSSGLSPELGDRLRSLAEVDVASAYRIGEWRVPGAGNNENGASSAFGHGFGYVTAVDADMDQVVRLGIIEGDFADVDTDGIMLHRTYAEERSLSAGDPFAIEYPSGVIGEYTVAAIYSADLFGGGAASGDLIISMETFEANYDIERDQMVILKLADGVDAEEVRPTLEAVVDEYPNAEMNNAEEYLDKVGAQIDMVLNILTGLLGMAIVIALLGITNTLTLSIMERKREIGLLRAVGMSRRQVRRMVRWESILIAVFGAALGLVVGVALGVAVATAIGRMTIGVPWLQLGIYALASAIGGVLAAIWPARRGARTDLLEAIAFE